MLPSLRVSGNRIVDASSGVPVRLRGINRSGLEYAPSLAAAGITVAELDEMIGGWGANLIRIPFNQTWALENPAYLPEIDLLIEEIARRGAYTLLDLQWIDAVKQRGTNGDGSSNFVPPLPNADSLRLWHEMAGRYRGRSSVLYDVFNEPHDVLPDDPVDLLGIEASGQTFPLRGRAVGMDEWRPWATQLVQAIRDPNPEALLFVPGVDWAYDLRGFPLAGMDGIVYSTHVYPSKGRNWNASFGNLSKRCPVFVGEFGGTEKDLSWGETLLRYIDEHALGWAAWSWADHPHLVNAGFAPTHFGSLVQSALRQV